jgi:hypothetical protein
VTKPVASDEAGLEVEVDERTVAEKGDGWSGLLTLVSLPRVADAGGTPDRVTPLVSRMDSVPPGCAEDGRVGRAGRAFCGAGAGRSETVLGGRGGRAGGLVGVFGESLAVETEVEVEVDVGGVVDVDTDIDVERGNSVAVVMGVGSTSRNDALVEVRGVGVQPWMEVVDERNFGGDETSSNAPQTRSRSRSPLFAVWSLSKV